MITYKIKIAKNAFLEPMQSLETAKAYAGGMSPVREIHEFICDSRSASAVHVFDGSEWHRYENEKVEKSFNEMGEK